MFPQDRHGSTDSTIDKRTSIYPTWQHQLVEREAGERQVSENLNAITFSNTSEEILSQSM